MFLKLIKRTASTETRSSSPVGQSQAKSLDLSKSSVDTDMVLASSSAVAHPPKSSTQTKVWKKAFGGVARRVRDFLTRKKISAQLVEEAVTNDEGRVDLLAGIVVESPTDSSSALADEEVLSVITSAMDDDTTSLTAPGVEEGLEIDPVVHGHETTSSETMTSILTFIIDEFLSASTLEDVSDGSNPMILDALEVRDLPVVEPLRLGPKVIPSAALEVEGLVITPVNLELRKPLELLPEEKAHPLQNNDEEAEAIPSKSEVADEPNVKPSQLRKAKSDEQFHFLHGLLGR